jgi:DNA replication protein DnaC
MPSVRAENHISHAYDDKVAGRICPKVSELHQAAEPAKVLILDDFGLRKYSREEVVILVDVLEERDEHGSVVVTSKVNEKGWMKLFDDPLVAEAIVNRPAPPAQKLALSGGSYREGLQPKDK